MINQYHLMSHISLHQHKIDRFELGTTSKYITNYIEQRKALMLAKLARNPYSLERGMEEVIEQTKNMYNQQTSRGSLKQHSNTDLGKKTLEVSGIQKPNKINKNDNFHRLLEADKFIARNNMYERQKHLNFKFQKRKHLHTEAVTHKFKPDLPKKEQHIQSYIIERTTQKQEETYHQRHEKKHSKNLSDYQRVSFKDLMKESMTKFNQNKQKPSTARDQRQRWKQIEQIFQKVNNQTQTNQKPQEIKQQTLTKNIQEQRIKEDQIHNIEIDEVKLVMKKIESDEERIKDFVQNLQMQQHFQEDLSGIMVDDDLKDEVDSSHVFQKVVNEMMSESEQVKPEINFLKIPFDEPKSAIEDVQIIQTISVLGPEQVDKDEDIIEYPHYHQLIQVSNNVFQQEKDEKKENGSEQHIQIQKVESQIIENSEILLKEQSIKLIQSRVEPVEHPQDIEVDKQSPNVSLIDKLSDEIAQQGQKVEPHITESQLQQPKQVEVEQQSLEILANQFILARVKNKRQQNEDIDIPDEEEPTITLFNLDFKSLSHELTSHIINQVQPLLDPQAVQAEAQILANSFSQQNEQTIQEIQQEEAIAEQEVLRVNNVIRTLRSFGQFMVIPEQSEEESFQSVA